MVKPNVSQVVKNVRENLSKHSPEILTGLGITGMITTTVLAVRATPKALDLIEREKRRQNRKLIDEATQNGYEERNQISRLKPIEIVKVAWKPYIPAVVSGTFAIACLIGANSVNARRNAALATAYKLSETALSEYREKVIETIGERREEHIKDKVAEERINSNPVSKNEIVITEKGNTLCFDPISGRYFRSDIDKIRRAENELNRRMLHDITGYVSLNEFYDELMLPHTAVGYDMGWNVDKLLKIHFSPHIAENDEPCVVIDYEVAPKYNYDKFM